MIRHRVLGFVVAVTVVGGCGGGSHHSPSASSDTTPASRTVDVTMRDIAYEPTTVPVHVGETVAFVFHNEGKIPHDAFLGDEAAQAEHEKEMRGGGMDKMADHGGGNAITVEPGKTGMLSHTFRPAESLIIGCHQAGHYQAGMKLALTAG